MIEEIKKCNEAIENLLNGYDAFCFMNKYGSFEETTNCNDFKILIEILKEDEMSMRALNWIKNCYDCYYVKDFDNNEDNAFNYLKNKIKELEQKYNLGGE